MITSEIPLVSVCIPTYNRADRLKRAVDKVLDCTYENIEIIISDNASTDSTRELCVQLCSLSPAVRYFRHEANQGPTKNFEFARSKAKGKYFLWHGDDDYLDNNYIAGCVKRLESDESLILVSGVAAFHRGDGVITHYGLIHNVNSSYPLLRALKYLFFVGDNSIFCGAYRRESVNECVVPNCLAGDWIWLAEVLMRGRVVMLPELFVIREYGENTSISPASIVSTLNAPHWHARYPLLAMVLNVAKFLSMDSYRRSGKSVINCVLTYFSIFLVMVLKMIVSFMREWVPRIPFAKKIYYKIFN